MNRYRVPYLSVLVQSREARSRRDLWLAHRQMDRRTRENTVAECICGYVNGLPCKRAISARDNDASPCSVQPQPPSRAMRSTFRCSPVVIIKQCRDVVVLFRGLRLHFIQPRRSSNVIDTYLYSEPRTPE